MRTWNFISDFDAFSFSELGTTPNAVFIDTWIKSRVWLFAASFFFIIIINDDVGILQRLGNEAQKSDILLWKLNKRSLWEQILDDMYHAALNLKLRLVHELEQAKDV